MAPKKLIALTAAVVTLLIVRTLSADAAPVAYARHVSRSITGQAAVDGISVVNLATGTLVKTLPLTCVDDFALAPDGTRLFVVCSTSRLITVVDTSTGGTVASAQLDDTPENVVITPDGNRLLVGGWSAQVIDARTLHVISRFHGASGRWSVPSDGSLAYVVLGGVVGAMDPVNGVGVRTLNVPGPSFLGQGAWNEGVSQFTISPDGLTGWGLQFVGSYTQHLVAVDMGTGAVTGRWFLSTSFPQFLGFDAAGSRLWLREYPFNYVFVVDTVRRQVSRVQLGVQPSAAAFSTDGQFAYLANEAGRFMGVFDAQTAAWTGMNINVDVYGPIVVAEWNSLSVLTSGEGRVSSTDGFLDCGRTCGSLYPPGAAVTLTPIASAGWVSAGWQGDADCIDGSLAMTADRSCTAVFRPASAATPPRALEFNGDGIADIFLYNPTTGSWGMALGNGAGAFALAGDTWSPEWKVVAASLNGDDLADLFVYNESTGFWYQAINAGGGRFAYSGGRFSPGWHVLAGRFRPDLLDDILVYSPVRGGAFLCFVDGAGQFTNYAFFDWSPGWDLRVIDLDGDGISDVFAYNPASGRWSSCLNTGTEAFSYVGGSWSPGWTLTVGDFNGNGRDDLFVYNVENGFWYTCLSVGDGTFTYRGGSWSPGQVVFRARLTTAPRDDVFTYDPASGSWAQWFGDGAGGFSGSLRGTWSTGWTIAVADLSGDGVDDVFTYNATTGAFFDCITNPTGGFAACVPGRTKPGFIAVAR